MGDRWFVFHIDNQGGRYERLSMAWHIWSWHWHICNLKILWSYRILSINDYLYHCCIQPWHRKCRNFHDTLQWRHMSFVASQTDRLFVQQFTQANIKGNIKGRRYWPFVRESTVDRWIPFTNGQQRGNHFHVMTSSRVPPLAGQDDLISWVSIYNGS